MNMTNMTRHMETHGNLQPCIDACRHCHATCLHTAMVHCLVEGGKNVEAGHFRLLLNCAEICQTSVNFLLSGSAHLKKICTVCAEICDACVASCKQIGGLDDCISACRECANSCREMSDAKR